MKITKIFLLFYLLFNSLYLQAVTNQQPAVVNMRAVTNNSHQFRSITGLIIVLVLLLLIGIWFFYRRSNVMSKQFVKEVLQKEEVKNNTENNINVVESKKLVDDTEEVDFLRQAKGIFLEIAHLQTVDMLDIISKYCVEHFSVDIFKAGKREYTKLYLTVLDNHQDDANKLFVSTKITAVSKTDDDESDFSQVWVFVKNTTSSYHWKVSSIA